MCRCCNEVHKAKFSQATIVEAEKLGDNNGGDKKDEQLTSGGGAKNSKELDNPHSTSEESYSDEDNAKIIEMKADKASWKDILNAIGKTSQSQIKLHWKSIDPNVPRKSGEPQAEKTDEEVTIAKKKSAAEKKKAEGIARGLEKKKEREEKRAKETNQDVGTVEEVNIKDNNNVVNNSTDAKDLKSWSDRYDKHKWMAAASKHFDLTGQRITPAMARKMALGH